MAKRIGGMAEMEHWPGICECCRRHGIVGVASSGYGAVSFGWCMQCLRHPTHPEPEWVLAYLYYDVGDHGDGLVADELLPGTFRDGRYWTWREWADRFAKEFEPPPSYDSYAWTGREPTLPPLWLQRLAYPTYSCEDCEGSIQYGCHCSYDGAVAPGIGPERWRVALRRFLKFWWMWRQSDDI